MFNASRKAPAHIIIDDQERTKLVQSLSRIMGQLQNIKNEIDCNDACSETFTQLLAVRGGINKIATDLVGFGILDCMQNKSKTELQAMIQNIFKVS